MSAADRIDAINIESAARDAYLQNKSLRAEFFNIESYVRFRLRRAGLRHVYEDNQLGGYRGAR